MKAALEKIIAQSKDRLSLWESIIQSNNCKAIAELGVFTGEYAARMLKSCPQIEKYTMVDPWRNLSDWNKPANKDNDTFEAFYQETLDKTDFAKEKRIVLRGKTTEVISEIPDNSLDFVYIDGDHTLKGISIDLINIWDKISDGGFIAGDDFSPTIWQHSKAYEPTMVFPFAVYFAEAKACTIYGLPHNQFIMQKQKTGFEFIDLSGGAYKSTELRTQLNNRSGGQSFGLLRKVYRKLFK